MANVPMEFGPYGNNPPIPVGAGLQPHLFGYGPGPLPEPIRQAVSTGRAIAGIAGTAMGQLANLQNGVPHTMVFFDLMAPIR